MRFYSDPTQLDALPIFATTTDGGSVVIAGAFNDRPLPTGSTVFLNETICPLILRGPGSHLMDTTGTLCNSVKLQTLALGGLGQTETKIVVPVRRRIPVAIRRTQVVRVIVERTTTNNAIRSGCHPIANIINLRFISYNDSVPLTQNHHPYGWSAAQRLCIPALNAQGWVKGKK